MGVLWIFLFVPLYLIWQSRNWNFIIKAILFLFILLFSWIFLWLTIWTFSHSISGFLRKVYCLPVIELFELRDGLFRQILNFLVQLFLRLLHFLSHHLHLRVKSHWWKFYLLRTLLVFLTVTMEDLFQCHQRTNQQNNEVLLWRAIVKQRCNWLRAIRQQRIEKSFIKPKKCTWEGSI